MGTSTNGQICYGVLFDEDYEFPWDDEQWESDWMVWWGDVGGEERAPFDAVNVCSAGYPRYILATPSSTKTAWRGWPEEFEPRELVVDEGERDALLEFCDKYGLEIGDGPKWYLSSYWG